MRLKDTVMRAERAEAREEQARLAAEGMRLANACIERDPKDHRCIYYRAMATGLFYEVRVIGYQKGVKQMIDDALRCVALAPQFANAGPYRMLGQLYTQLPKTTIHPGDVTRDLATAREYLTKAVEIVPGYPENHLALCEALLEADETAEAGPVCHRAEQLTHSWTDQWERTVWAKKLAELKKRLAK